MTDEVKLLSDDEVAEIANRKSYQYGTMVSLTVAERDALCATVRALRQQVDEWESHRRGFIELFETAEARVTDLEAENTALREQLAEV